MKLIDKDALVAEIERRIKEISKEFQESKSIQYTLLGKINALENLLPFINTLEVKEVDFDKEIETHLKECLDIKFPTTDVELIKKDVTYTAQKFFELGLKANQEYNVIGTIEREVKIDAGGYPYINCDIEFYDYDKDIPLAKEGDKIKVIMVKEK